MRDDRTGFFMTGPFMRAVGLFLCVRNRPYPIGRDEAVLQKSNRDLGRFLARVLHVPDKDIHRATANGER